MIQAQRPLRAVAVLLAAAAATASAQPVLITSPTTINPGDTVISGVPLATAEITVRGTTLTVNGRHSIASLLVERSAGNQAGVVTHDTDFRFTDGGEDRFGLHLIVTGSMMIQGSSGSLVASRIDVNGRGYNFGEGPGAGTGGTGIECAGGGGHGGGGGRSRHDCSSVPGGPAYGSIAMPMEFGSGGGRDNSGLGGRGGGSVRLEVSGALALEGAVNATGANGGGNESGAGAGGSIWITCGSLSGAGSCGAGGGRANATYAGGGGGGRIAIYAGSSTFTGVLNNAGGDGYARGGAGTSLYKVGTARATVFMDNNGAGGLRENTEFEGESMIDADVVVRNGARMGPRAGQAGMHLIVTGNLTIEATGELFASGYGHSSDEGPGPGVGGLGVSCAGGGGHGGAGGRSRFDCSDVEGGIAHGSITQPIDMGSGGGRDNNSLGGAGGGAIQMTVSGAFTHDGAATASGNGTGGTEAGGGAGGSIWIDCGSLAGSGSFVANGGGANSTFAGGGAGGRIAVHAGAGSFAGTFLAAGGAGYSRGGAGTSLLKIGSDRATIWIDNDGATSIRETTEFYGTTVLDADVVVRGGARVGPRREQTDFDLTVTGDLTVETGSALYADGRGHPSDAGPGTGLGGTGIDCAGGGGHGGAGGRSRESCGDTEGGTTYDSITHPTGMGSGGGRDNQALGGAGGGAIRLIVGGALTVDGSASAAGLSNAGAEAGGGAGGSIWIDCGSLAGSGAITADGGGANSTFSGGGGGGRIAVYAASGSTHTGLFRCAGGVAQNTGGAGTALLKAGANRATVFIDNADRGGLRETTELAGPEVLDANILVTGAARLGPRREQTDFDLTITGDLTIDAGASLYADGRGYPSDSGPGTGAGGVLVDCAGGGGHGGAGGGSRDNCSAVSGGIAYDSITQPTDMGSGGGRDNTALGGAGGGAMRVVIGGALTLHGAATAAGLANTGAEAGGGAGGSIWIDCNSFAGSGTMTANGGSANATFAGGGGGGRIAVYAASGSLFSGDFRCSGGAAQISGGAGTALLKDGANRAVIFIDNTGVSNSLRETTELPGPTSLDASMIVRGNARLGPRREQTDFDLTLTGDLTIDADGEIYGDGRGFPSWTGPGAGTGGPGIECAGGGGYGGRGGNSRSNCNNSAGGAVYGDASSPIEMGSGGGRDNAALGGAGGGAIRLTVAGAIVLDGRMGVDGAASGGADAGGGSGGSVFVTCGGIGGAGTITARGGSANATFAGGGGGGRIAVYTCNNLLPPSSLIVTGGSGQNAGDAGSTSFGSSSITITQHPVGGAYRGGDFFQMGVQATGDGSLTYQWRKRDGLGVLVPISEGQDGVYTEVNSNTLFIAGIDCSGAGDYDCLVCDACGCFPSNVATVTVDAPGDFNMDGGIDGADVEAFFTEWEAGGERGDINQDGGIDGSDVEFFFDRWERGC